MIAWLVFPLVRWLETQPGTSELWHTKTHLSYKGQIIFGVVMQFSDKIYFLYTLSQGKDKMV